MEEKNKIWSKELQEQGVKHINKVIKAKKLEGQEAYSYAIDYARKHGLHYEVRCSKCLNVFERNGKFIPNRCKCLGGHGMLTFD